jgi:hypothetical protein
MTAFRSTTASLHEARPDDVDGDAEREETPDACAAHRLVLDDHRCQERISSTLRGGW